MGIHLTPGRVLLLLAVLSLGALTGAPARSAVLSGPVQALFAAPERAGSTAVVEVWFTSAAAADQANFRAVGAQVQFRAGRRLQCRVPVSQLGALGALPGVVSVTLPSPLVSPQIPGGLSAARAAFRATSGPRTAAIYGFGATVSQAVQLTNASAFQANGIAGLGSTIAIIATGFAGAADAEIPNHSSISFRADEGMGSDATGTAMAELVADMAPQAGQTLIAVDTTLSLRQAINYVAANKFTAAVCAVSSVEGPFDGSDMVSQALPNATNAGVFWVQAAGDLAQRHWQGQFSDLDGDGFQDLNGGTGIALNLPAGDFQAFLSWYQSAGATTAQDYDLALYQGSGTSAPLIAQSSITQNGMTPPAEFLLAHVPAAGVYELRIKVINANLSKPDFFQLYTPSVDMPSTIAVPANSLPSPAMSPAAFTVGATWGSLLVPSQLGSGVDSIESFSGQGPTISGLLKPDMVAPDRVSTSLAAFTPFLSTAAAAAHMGGAVGLLFSEDRNRTPDAIKRILLRQAIKLPADGTSPNDIYGAGRLNLRVGIDTEAPSITIFYPQNSTTISSRTPLVRAKITDTGNGVNPATIVLKIDGVAVTGFIFDASTGFLSYVVTNPLSLTSHQITIDASDNAGNAATEAVVNFRIALPTLEAGLHLFSLPYTFAPTKFPTPQQLFGMTTGIQVARWWPGDGQYHIYPDPYATFSPPDAVEPGAVVPKPPAGLAYFVNLAAPATLNITGTPVSGLDEYDIQLPVGSRAPLGWNMIGCPFLSAVDFGSVQFVTKGVHQTLAQAVAAGVTDGVLFGFRTTASGGFYTFPTDPFAAVLEPFQGYWLHVLKDTTMVLFPPAVAMQMPMSTNPVAAASSKGWRLQLVSSAAGHVDPCAFVGMNSAAPAQYSPLWAVGEPPAVDDVLQAALVEKNWGERSGQYAQVIKPAAGAQEWELQVVCRQPNTDVAVRWPELNAVVPSGVTLLLQDIDTGEEVYMRTSAGYTFNSGPQGGVRRLRVIASTGTASNLSLSGVSAQATAGGNVAFTYALSQPAEVGAEIRNISGVMIKQFATRHGASGSVELLVWNGRSDRGSKVPAGRYLVRITARTDKGQTVQAIRPFEVIP
jgi:hypothetical protein